MPHISTLEMSEEQWQARRSVSEGSSDVGTILGLNTHKTPLRLYQEKVGEVEREPENKHMEWGTELEEFCARMFVKKHPGTQVRQDNKIRIHPDYEWACCNLDRLIVGGEEPVILELKTTTSYAIQQWDAEIPTNYYAQLQWQLFVCGYHKAIIWVAVLDKKDWMELPVERSDEFIEKMFKIVDEFHSKVIKRDPTGIDLMLPDVEAARPVVGTRIEASEDVLSKITQLTELKAKIGDMEKVEKGLTEEVKLFIGVNENLVQGERVLATYTSKHRDSYVVPAADYRVLSLKREKKERKAA